MWIDENGPGTPRKFWSVNRVFREAEARRPEMDLKKNLRDAVREFLREALVESIRYHMVADVPVGLFLSGGRDSGTLLSLAAEEKLGNLRTLVLGFNELRGTEGDEVILAEQTASSRHVRHEVRWIGSENFAGECEQVFSSMDQPTIDGVNVYFVSQMAADAGLKVALSGLGADELFGGYPSFRQIPQIVNLLAPFAEMHVVPKSFRVATAPILKHLTSPKFASIFEYGTDVEGAYLLRRGLYMPWELPSVLDPEIVKQGWGDLAAFAHLSGTTNEIDNTHAKIAALEMEFYMRNQLLRDSDWAGMAHSIEIRVPFVDSFLLEQVAPLLLAPTQLGKEEMTDVLNDPLPNAVLDRPKTGFSAPVREWLIKSQPIEKGQPERGLRGWAKYVLKEQSQVRPERAERSMSPCSNQRPRRFE